MAGFEDIPESHAQAGDDAEILPPSYTDNIAQVGSPESNQQNPIPKPTNYVKVSRPTGQIQGSWIIDPTIEFHQSFLPPLSAGETRRNIHLEANLGNINADVFVLPSAKSKSSESRLSIRTFSSGWVVLKLHDSLPQNDSKSRHPMRISITSTTGSAYIHLPRSFKGLLKLQGITAGSVEFSNEVKLHSTPISEMGNVVLALVGEVGTSDWNNKNEWDGDELTVVCYIGKVKIYFVDEDIKEEESKCVCT